jgi:exopolysaccharide biosynthesis polyprenyl glycosylphosphotransferase
MNALKNVPIENKWDFFKITVPPKTKEEPDFAVRRYRREPLENALSLAAMVGDFVMIVIGFLLAFWIRFHTSLIPAYKPGQQAASLSDYWKLILIGSFVVFLGLQRRNLYSYKKLLFPFKTISKFAGILGICMFAFLSILLIVRTYPPISRTFVLLATFLIILNVAAWRLALGRILRLSSFSSILRRRVVVIGGGQDRMRIQEGVEHSTDLTFIGWVQVHNKAEGLEENRLGSIHELPGILRKHAIDIAVVLNPKVLSQEAVSATMKICENEHVQFKIVPQFFDVLISRLRPNVIGGVTVLGVESLPLRSYENWIIKRMLDIAGALVGLVLAIPLILIFGSLVYWESPGPIIYTQLRLGRSGRLFRIYKIRSMQMSAEENGEARWAQPNDSRRLRIGKFMRKYNIDEVPQFWNVLKGEMSLVGPRPERPSLISKFKNEIPHYNARHTCLPGMTGWAQVNGWRGNTSLQERIRHDIWYVENWSFWLEVRILYLTFFRHDNAY